MRVRAAGRWQSQSFRVSPSYASGSLVPLHFGLGEAAAAEEVEIRWPSGRSQSFRDVAAAAPGGCSRGTAWNDP